MAVADFNIWVDECREDGLSDEEILEEIKDLKRMFRKPRELVLVECEVEGIRGKEHSRANVLLADRMKLLRIIEKLEIC